MRDSHNFYIHKTISTYIKRRYPTPSKWTIDEVQEFTYLGLLLDPALSMYEAAEHACQKINWAHLTIAAVAHNLRYDTPPELKHTRSSPLILYRLWQSCVLPFATQHLRYFTTHPQVQKVQIAHSDATQSTISFCKSSAFPPLHPTPYTLHPTPYTLHP